jgi:ppGpp synthetase/RelA/SpoT-type nucleotidyltranferase
VIDSTIQLDNKVTKQIDNAVKYFKKNLHSFEPLAKNLYIDILTKPKLKKLIHSAKYRIKKPDHLRDKLFRLARETKEKKEAFDITKENLFTKVNDLAGVRLIHLHTKQMAQIHPLLLDVFDENRYTLDGDPTAFTWDDEYAEFFKSIKIRIEKKDSMYTSVHYILKPNRRTEMRCELQVRTLAEEIWGEVSHTISYPHEVDSVACIEQLKVLARVASGCTRLVDSIFASHTEYLKKKRRK